MEAKISTDIQKNIHDFNKALNIEENFDIIYRVIEIGKKTCCLYLIDGLNKDDILEKLMTSFYGIKEADMPTNAHAFFKALLPYGEVDLMDEPKQIVTTLLSGVPMLFVDGFEAALAIDFRTYPARSIEEPRSTLSLSGSSMLRAG